MALGHPSRARDPLAPHLRTGGGTARIFHHPTHCLPLQLALVGTSLVVPKTPLGKSSDAFSFVVRAHTCPWSGNAGSLRVFPPRLMSAASGPAGFLNAQVACDPSHA